MQGAVRGVLGYGEVSFAPVGGEEAPGGDGDEDGRAQAERFAQEAAAERGEPLHQEAHAGVGPPLQAFRGVRPWRRLTALVLKSISPQPKKNWARTISAPTRGSVRACPQLSRTAARKLRAVLS